MLKRAKVVFVVAAIAVFAGAWSLLGTAVAQTKAGIPRPQNRLALGESDVKQLLLLMETDKNGKVSKEEFMKFMEAEFERLDKENNGQLDVKELTQSNLHASNWVGK